MLLEHNLLDVNIKDLCLETRLELRKQLAHFCEDVNMFYPHRLDTFLI